MRFKRVILRKQNRKSVFLHFLSFTPLIAEKLTSDSDSPLNFTSERVNKVKKEDTPKRILSKIFKKVSFLTFNISFQDNFCGKQ